MMSSGVRKAALISHVVCAAGWLGAVATFLALALVGLVGTDAERARAAYLAMDSVTWLAIVPLCFASLVTGLVQALGTTWGVFRHYWVVVKLLLTLVATIGLLIHTQPIAELAAAALHHTWAAAELQSTHLQLVVDAGAALVVLITATAFSVIKPRGLTRHGRRKEREERAAAAAT